ncbi:uncharacterized protein LOC120536800 [Polypterus senegalus]|uniref:uncharacterized protein LOC120536800 n=1 Tax=Polypterus senegalus TaxID=55291 RepID=UPI001963D5FD|nr:uncharacterized protein LOC120536800 [Polypterus senegalus]
MSSTEHPRSDQVVDGGAEMAISLCDMNGGDEVSVEQMNEEKCPPSPPLSTSPGAQTLQHSQRDGHNTLESQEAADIFIKLFRVQERKLCSYLKDLEKIADDMLLDDKSSTIVRVAEKSSTCLKRVLTMGGSAMAAATGGVCSVLCKTGTVMDIAVKLSGPVSETTFQALGEKKVKEILLKYEQDISEIRAAFEKMKNTQLTETSEEKERIESDLTAVVDTEKHKQIAKHYAIKALRSPTLVKTAKKCIKGDFKLAKEKGKKNKMGTNVSDKVVRTVSGMCSMYTKDKTDIAQNIRDKVKELRAELDSYKDLHDNLVKQVKESESTQHAPERPALPSTKVTSQTLDSVL